MGPSTSSPSFYAERAALSRLLRSGVFARSPNLEKILVYLCNKYFEGDSGIKEYHLATEALGRSADFDPKRDSIVRVEMHRLRRRLREYYESAPDEPVRILLPEKSYVPEFLFLGQVQVDTHALLLAAPAPVALLPAPQDALLPRTVTIPLPAPEPREHWWPTALAVGLVVVVVAIAGFWPRAARNPAALPAAETVPLDAPRLADTSALPEIRILAGRPGGRYVDRFRQVWEGDRFFTGGANAPVQNEVATRGLDSNIFTGLRQGEFSYDIPLPRASYELSLYFAETFYGERNPLGGGEASRIFHVTANGRQILRDFDALADAQDTNTATVRVFRDLEPAADGKLHLRWLSTGSGQPFVNAIVLRPGMPGRLRPIRIVCRPQAYRDAKGNRWEPDQHFRGGVQITRPHGAPTAEPEIFRGERYGNFSYIVPVPEGKYGARLYFWEYWWGEGHPGRGGSGSRVFSVYCNRRPLLHDFDIIGGKFGDQVTVQEFHGLTPDAQGKLVFEFVPKVNYGLVNAIEIIDETPAAATPAPGH